jgi:hypothetical protein
MKSQPVTAYNNWLNWTGDNLLWPGNGLNIADSVITQPTNDWAIFDLFTTAPNDNATRGQLSINQTNFAAWAAVLDGVIAVTNGPAPLIIDPNPVSASDPTGNQAALLNLVSSINATRAAGFTNGVFTRLGDILSVPALTVASPFLTNIPTQDASLTDEAYERLPQQIMSLLRVGSPRYVIYAYGQSLKPADRSLQVGGPFYGTCTNYQITGEMVARAVIRFEPSIQFVPANPQNPTRNPVLPGMPLGNQPLHAIIESFNVLPPE